jgi:hypothetical protein
MTTLKKKEGIIEFKKFKDPRIVWRESAYLN